MTLVVMPILVLLWASLANSSVVKLLMKERCIPRSAPQIFHFARSRTDNLLLAQSQHCNKHFGVFGWQIEMIFRQLLKGWFSPTLAITRETMTHRKFSKRIYEKKFHLRVICPRKPQNWKSRTGTLFRPAYSHGTRCREILFTSFVVQEPGSFPDPATFVWRTISE